MAATTGAITELTEQHDARLAGQRLALERATFEDGRAQRQFDAREPENRLVACTLEHRLEQALAGVEREQRALICRGCGRPRPPATVTPSTLSSLGIVFGQSWIPTVRAGGDLRTKDT